MVPVVGMDVAKGASVLQAFWSKNEPYGKAESIAHGETGFKRLGKLLAELQDKDVSGSHCCLGSYWT